MWYDVFCIKINPLNGVFMNLIYLILTILLLSIIAVVDMSYLSVSGIKSGQDRNNYLTYISSVRSMYDQIVLSDGSLDDENDKKSFLISISGDDVFKSPSLSHDDAGKYYVCIEKIGVGSKIFAAKEVVKMKPNISFFISKCEDFETKNSEYKDGDYIAFFLE